MAIKETFKKSTWTVDDELELQLLRKKKAQRFVVEKDVIQPRFRWLTTEDDRGSGEFKEVRPSIAKASLYGYGSFVIPVKHPKFDEIVRRMGEVFYEYAPDTKETKGARR